MGPIWEGGNSGEEEMLKSCYRESLKLALENNCESLAFPLISSGAYGYPKQEALQIAVSEISEFLLLHDMLIYIAVFDKVSFCISKKLAQSIEEYIDENYIADCFQSISSCFYENESEPFSINNDFERAKPYDKSLSDAVDNLDESFSQALLRIIDEKGLTDSEVYKKANVDRRLFSKIRSDANYKTSKQTALAFAIALELSLDETNIFLQKAGFALSHSNKFDIIIEYFIKNRNYSIFEINEALFAFDQQTIG